LKLDYFKNTDFYVSLKRFFKELNVPINYVTESPTSLDEIIENNYKSENQAHKLVEDVYFLGMVNDKIFKDEKTNINIDSFKDSKSDYDGLLIFGITLNTKEKLPSKSQLSEITRAFNREFNYTPVVVIFKYDNYISFANCERVEYKQKWREGEKIGKFSILKDIDFINTHTGHLKILQSLEISRIGKNSINSFSELYKYWQEVFNISILNKKFYNELFNWYLWALKEVEFPNAPQREEKESDSQYQEKLYSHKAVNVIRLITRLMFVWFLKEKKVNEKTLIPDGIFDENYLLTLLDYKDKTGSTYYKAILQNLFFATLNTEMAKDKPESRKFINKQSGVQSFYR